MGFRSQDNYLPRDRKGYKYFHSMIDPTTIVLIWIFPQIQKRADMTSRLIRSGFFNRLSSPVRAKVECCESHDFLVARLQTVQPPGSLPQVLRVATHGQQVASLWVEGLPLCKSAVSIFYSPSWLDEAHLNPYAEKQVHRIVSGILKWHTEVKQHFQTIKRI